MLTLALYDFGINFYNKRQADQLFKALRTKYEISIDWTGCNYCGLTIQWEYDKGYVDISIPRYIQAELQRVQHPAPSKVQHAPLNWTAPSYGTKF